MNRTKDLTMNRIAPKQKTKKSILKPYLKIIFLCIFLSTFYLNGQTKFIEANHPAFQYIGRFDSSNPKEVKFDWPGTTIQFKFTGKHITFHLKGGDRNYFNLFLDGKLHTILHKPKDTLIQIKGIETTGLHTLRLQKRTEGEMGVAVFKGIDIAKSEKIETLKPDTQRKLEFIGNSITCGYGAEGVSRKEKFSPSTENVNKSYASIVARAFDASTTIIAHSGLGVIRNYGDNEKISLTREPMPKRFDQVLDTDLKLKWDFKNWHPDAVIVNLGTNDYSTQPHPDKIAFQREYEQFIQKIRIEYGTIPIFIVSGPLINEPAYSNIKEVVTNIKILKEDNNLYFLGIPKFLLNNTSDLGSDSHPSYRGQIKMAAHIIPAIANIMKWSYKEAELKLKDSY